MVMVMVMMIMMAMTIMKNTSSKAKSTQRVDSSVCYVIFDVVVMRFSVFCT